MTTDKLSKIVEKLEKDNDIFFNKCKQETQFNNIFVYIYTLFSENLLDTCNKVILDENLTKEYKIGFQNGTIAALKILLDSKRRFIDENK